MCSSDLDVDGKPTIAETLPRFLQFLGDAPSIMMAHNASFDMGFLTMAWGRLRQPSPSHTVVDTIPLARERLPLRNYKLETIGRHLGLIDDERHRALDDSMLLKNVFVNLVEREPAITTLAALFAITPELSFQHHEVAITQPPLGFEGLAIAISEGQSIKLVYDGGTSPGSPRIVTPLAFVKEGGRLYLSALCHKSRIEKSYRLDRIVSGAADAPIGVVTVGKAHEDAMHALRRMGIDRHPQLAVYKIALAWPLEAEGLRAFARGKRAILVIEEKRSFVESQIRDALYHLPADERPDIAGKTMPGGEKLLTELLELSPEIVAGEIGRAHV